MLPVGALQLCEDTATKAFERLETNIRKLLHVSDHVLRVQVLGSAQVQGVEPRERGV
jgi:hypothetical protein